MSGTPARVGIVGTGWRAATYLDLSRLLPELYEVRAVMAMSTELAAQVEATWPVRAVLSTAELPADELDFVIACVPPAATPGVAGLLAAAGHAVLIETPPAETLSALSSFHTHCSREEFRIQVAEQYPFRPAFAAQAAGLGTGLIGDPQIARLSVAHGPHAVRLARTLLGVGFEPVSVTARGYVDRSLAGWGRTRSAPTDRSEPAHGVRAELAWSGGRTALIDFNDTQYFSPIRAQHLSVHGIRGEVHDDSWSWVGDDGQLCRMRTAYERCGTHGDLDPLHLKRISLGERTLFANPFAPSSLSDEQIAIAETIRRMRDYVETGLAFSSLEDACHDQYLSLLIAQAQESGRRVESTAQVWQGEVGR